MTEIDNFLAEMRKHDLAPMDGDIIADGTLHRYAPVGAKKDDLYAWYIFHLDTPVSGAFGSWKHKKKYTWTGNSGRELSLPEKEELKKRIEADRKRKARAEEEDREKAKKTADYLWRISPPPSPEHPYLKRKGIKPHNLRLSESGHYAGCLLVPVTNNGVLVGIQFIAPEKPKNQDGEELDDKRFLGGTPIAGSYTLIGPRPGLKFGICEGYATGASIFESTGIPMIVAFNAANLVPVAKAMRERLPDAEIFIAADDDRWTTKPMKNPGIHYAQIAAAEINATLRRPVFAPGFEGKPTDFNDLFARHGIEEVKSQIMEGTPSFDQNALIEASAPTIWGLLEPFPHMSSQKGGKPLATMENLEELLKRMNVTVRYNVISKNEEIIVPGESYSIDNKENAAYARVVSWCAFSKMPTDKLGNYLTAIADRNQYNPVATWITSRPWDGKPRMQELFDTVRTDNEIDPKVKRVKEFLMRKWLLSAVAAAFRPNGVSAHGILVFQGAQYLGKTAWFKKLAPPDLEVIADGMMLKIDDKDSIKQVVSNWLVELGELDATFKRSDIAQLKAFITKDRDVLRQAYARKESSFARRTVFFASVNPEEFLHDPTGNRRYWTIACVDINHRHEIDMQQVWAEVYELFKDGNTWYLTPEEMDLLNEHNREFEVRDPIEEKLRSAFDWSSSQGSWEFRTATEILDLIGMGRPSSGELTKAGHIVRRLNGGKWIRSSGSRKLLSPQKRDLSQVTKLYGDQSSF